MLLDSLQESCHCPNQGWQFSPPLWSKNPQQLTASNIRKCWGWLKFLQNSSLKRSFKTKILLFGSLCDLICILLEPKLFQPFFLYKLLNLLSCKSYICYCEFVLSMLNPPGRISIHFSPSGILFPNSMPFYSFLVFLKSSGWTRSYRFTSCLLI